MKSIYYSLLIPGNAIAKSGGKAVKFLGILTLLLIIMSPTMAANTTIEKQSYGTTADGVAVDEYTLTNDSGMEVKIITYGGIVTSIRIQTAMAD